MIKKRHGWKGNYRWGRDSCWSNNAWNFNMINGFRVWYSTTQGLSLIAGTAFAQLTDVNLGSYVGVDGTSTPWKLTIKDAEGDTAIGFVGAAGAGESLDGELVTNGTFTTDTTGWTNRVSFLYDTFEVVAGKLHLVSDGSAVAYCYCDDNVALVIGALYKISITIDLTSGSIRTGIRQAPTAGTAYFIIAADEVGTQIISSDGTYSYYHVATATENVIIQIYQPLASACELTADNVSMKQVIECAATGVHIVSAKDGATRNWTSIGTNFNYNGPRGITTKGYRAELRRA